MANLLEQVVYQSKAMQQVRAEVGPYIESATPILFWGETGSGMGFYAKAIHEVSGRTGKFIQIPGFSLDKDSVKQQFLGLEEKSGWLEEADGGTIFLKRISETPLAVQQTLLHLIGSQSVDGRLQFSRKGTTETLEVNVRFLYSMAHNFNIALQDDLLRRDFVDELKKRGRIIHLPPLRERKEDIVTLAENFLLLFNEKYQQHMSVIDRNAAEILQNYVWPGNINELKQVIEQIFSQYPGLTTINAEHLPERITHPEIRGDHYSFKLKSDVKFMGRIISPLLKIESENQKLTLNTGDLTEVVRVEDPKFTPPKFKHYIFRLKDGGQITGKILDKKLRVETSFEPNYQVVAQDIYSIYLA